VAAYYYNNLGVALMEQGMAKTEVIYYREAAKEFQAALSISPDYVNARINLGLAFYYGGGKEPEERKQYMPKAKEQFEEVLRRDPNNPHAHFMLGLILKNSEKSGDEAKRLNEEMTAHFQAVLKQDPNDAFSHHFLGFAQGQLGRYNEAIQPCRRAVELNPGSVEMRYQYFMSLQRAGKSDEAKVQQAAFLALGGGKGGSTDKSPDYLYARRGKYSEGIIEQTPAPAQPRSLRGIGFADATSLALSQQKSPPLNFKHQGTAMDAEVAKAWNGEPMPKEWFVKNKGRFVAAFGSGAAVGDYDNDGYADVYLVNSAVNANALLHNNGNGAFTNVTAKAGVGGNGSWRPGMAAVWGDSDNDGDLDLLVTTYGGVILYRNNGNGTFTDITRPAGLNNVPADTWCMGAAFADVDHDGDLDVYVCNYADLTRLPDKPTLQFPDDFQGQPNFLFRNNFADRDNTGAPGHYAPTPFTEIAAQAKVDGGRRKHLGVIFSDFDNDNAVDFLLANDGDPNALFVNNRDRTFRETTLPAQNKEESKGRAGGVAVADVNQDGNTDVFVANADKGAPSLLLGSANGTFRTQSLAETLKRSDVQTPERIMGVGFLDLDNDGFLDLFVTRSSLPGQAPAHPTLLHNQGGTFRDVSDEVNVKVSEASPIGGKDNRFRKLSDYPTKAARGMALGDFNNDGRPDVVIVNNGDQPTLLSVESGFQSSETESPSQGTSPTNNWLKVRVIGYGQKGAIQSNKEGVGAKVEVRAPGLWARQELTAGGGYLSCNSSELLFGIGERLRVDFVRGIFPSGIRASQLTLANNRVSLIEPAGEPPSCPYLYAWNGQRFEFICDVLAAGTIGELVTPTQYLNLPPFEPVRIDGAQLQPKDGAYLFSLVNQLPEVDYIEQARLLVVDHPADVEVYPDNRLTGHPRPPSSDLWVVRDARLPIAATDEAGRDLLPLIARKDRRYHTDLKPLPWRGFAQRHSLTLQFQNLEFGNRNKSRCTLHAARRTLQPVLLLHGYIAWGGSSTALGAGQAGVFYEMPKLEVRDERGQWKVIDADMGIPAGHPRTIVVPLKLGKGERGKGGKGNVQVRITTNMTIYWDEVRIGFAEHHSPLATRVHEAALRNAALRFLGYPQPDSPDGRKPYLYDYYRRADFKDLPSFSGSFTRYGDVTPLLKQRDDMFAIINHGDEVRMAFDARSLPVLRTGWQRDYILLLWGYGKSTDVNTAHSLTVEPLPFAAMSGYPYPISERYPMDEKHLRYRAEYNTRVNGFR
jgi:tetratricopeptide (TPR) repeat protein